MSGTVACFVTHMKNVGDQRMRHRVESGTRRQPKPMRVSLPCSSQSLWCIWPRMLALGLLFALPGMVAAQAPLRVAIVGLEHGHVEGFLQSLPQHSNVQLVGI